MIKEFGKEKDCLEWLKTQSGLRFYSETKNGRFVAVAIDLEEENGTN